MKYVSFHCEECGRYEDRMVHASRNCPGPFIWVGDEIKCVACSRTYATDQAFWCGNCGKRHYNFRLGSS